MLTELKIHNVKEIIIKMESKNKNIKDLQKWQIIILSGNVAQIALCCLIIPLSITSLAVTGSLITPFKVALNINHETEQSHFVQEFFLVYFCPLAVVILTSLTGALSTTTMILMLVLFLKSETRSVLPQTLIQLLSTSTTATQVLTEY